jgi:hypothetical protein
VLQDGKKITKCNPWACLGLFLGFSDLHSLLVPIVLNVDTGHTSLKFHVIFDNKFETVTSLAIGEPLNKQWADIFWLGSECFLDVDYDNNDQPILPSLSDTIKSYSKAKADQPNFELGDLIDFDGIMVKDASVPPPHYELLQEGQAVSPLQSQATSQATLPPTLLDVPSIPVMPVPRGEDNNSTVDGIMIGLPVQDLPAADWPWQNVGTYKDGPTIIHCLPINGESYDLTFSATILSEYAHPVLSDSNQGCFADYHPHQKLQHCFLAKCYLLQEPWFADHTCLDAVSHNLTLDSWASGGLYFNYISYPGLLAACSVSSKYNKDYLSFDTATHGPFQAQFWKAMYDELTTLVCKFGCWDYVPHTPDMNVLPSTWVFKIKRYPDGCVKKFKARFCARGDRQKEGIDYFETWAPVVQWSTVRVFVILAIKMKLISIQCNIAAASIHGRVTETIYAHQPRGFNHGKGDEVLCLKHTHYGLKQLPWYFFHYLTERLIKQGLMALQFDPCLFISKSLIVIIYVDDILIYW